MKHKRKLKSNNGFTLVELLVTVLVMSLAGIAMTTGFRMVQNSYNDMTKKANAETLLSTTIYEISSHVRYADNVFTDKEGNNTRFFDTNSGYIIKIDNPDKNDPVEKNLNGIIVRFYAGNKKLESHQLLSDKAMTDNLNPVIEYIKWNRPEDGNKPVTATFKVNVYDNENKDRKAPVASQEVTVNLINSPNMHKHKGPQKNKPQTIKVN